MGVYLWWLNRNVSRETHLVRNPDKRSWQLGLWVAQQ